MELFKPDLGLFIWMLISFCCLVLILKKYAWTGIISSIEERNSYISKSLDDAAEAQLKLKNLQQDSDALLDKAHEEQIALLHEGKKLKEAMLNEAKKTAQQEASRIVEEAHKAMARQKEENQKELEQRATLLSIQIAEKILKRELDQPEQQLELTKKLIDETNFSK